MLDGSRNCNGSEGRTIRKSILADILYNIRKNIRLILLSSRVSILLAGHLAAEDAVGGAVSCVLRVHGKFFESRAAGKDRIDACDAGRITDFFQRRAVADIGNIGDSLRKAQLFKRSTVIEDAVLDFAQTAGQLHFFEGGAAEKGILPENGHTLFHYNFLDGFPVGQPIFVILKIFHFSGAGDRQHIVFQHPGDIVAVLANGAGLRRCGEDFHGRQ